MTEAEWLAATDPTPMLKVLRGRSSERKLRLAACAIIRHAPFHLDGRTVWDLLPGYRWFRPRQPGSRISVDVHEAIALTERHADGQASPEQCESAYALGSGVLWCAEASTPLYTDNPVPGCWAEYAAAKLVYDATTDAPSGLRNRLLRFRKVFDEACPADLHSGNGASVCNLLRDSFGNPFRPVTADPSWLTSTVVSLASGIYAERAFDRLPIFADALQDAGCEDAEILGHCRSGGPHVRGCWVVDLILGKA